MTKVTLTYFDISGGRGEDCRLALHMANIDFVDDRVKSKDWKNLKPSTPFGAMPVLEVEGLGTLAQSNAILHYVGSQHGLLPSDSFEAAQHHALMDAAEDLRSRVAHTFGIKDEDELKNLREELAAGYMKNWAMNVEKLIQGPFVAGEKISVADLKLYVLLNWIKKGVLNHIPTDYFDTYPKLSGLFNAVASHPKVIEWHEMN